MSRDNRGPVNNIITDIPAHQVSLDIDAFNELIRGQGVRLVHYRAIRCPVGMTDIGDNRRPHPDHEGCSNGFLYTKVGVITGLFTGNSKNKRQDEVGFWDGSTAQVSFATTYDDSDDTHFYVCPYDRFYLDEPTLLVATWQLFQHHASGRDRLKFPVESVDILVDARGNRYHAGSDFSIKDGQLVWTGLTRPSPELDAGPGLGTSLDRGAVCSVWYRYRPYYYCAMVQHDLRVTQVNNEFDGTRSIQRMPMAAVLHREFIPQNSEADNEARPGNKEVSNKDLLRQAMGPTDGSFGQR
jgi:hypothetical protein